MSKSNQLFILVAGPYRSNTGDDPAKIEQNLRTMAQAALKVFRLSRMLAQRVDAVLRVGGASKGADEMADIARRTGKYVFENISEIPQIEADAMEEVK